MASGLSAGATAVAVFVLFEPLMGTTWGTGPAIIFVLLLTALPLLLLVHLATEPVAADRDRGSLTGTLPTALAAAR